MSAILQRHWYLFYYRGLEPSVESLTLYTSRKGSRHKKALGGGCLALQT